MANTVTVRKRKSQKHGFTYEYRFEIASVAGKRRWISKGGFTTEKDAVRAGVKAQNEYENGGRIIIPSELSFSDFLDYWIENDCKLTLKETTLLNYHKKLKNHIKPALGIYRLRTIDKDCLQGFLQKLHTKVKYEGPEKRNQCYYTCCDDSIFINFHISSYLF